jgi:hypothetical protein
MERDRQRQTESALQDKQTLETELATHRKKLDAARARNRCLENELTRLKASSAMHCDTKAPGSGLSFMFWHPAGSDALFAEEERNRRRAD